MKTLFKSFIAVAALIVLICCSRRDSIEATVKTGTLIFTPSVADMVITKSQLSVAENKLSTASVAVYDADGYLVKSVSVTEMGDIQFPLLHIGESYHAYAAFNMGSLSFPKNESDIGTLTLGWNTDDINTNGFPMTWSSDITLSSDGQAVEMEATRLVSKVRFCVDNSSLSGHNGKYTVSSVALKNSVRTVTVFSLAQSLLGEADYSSDSATESDITSVNAGNRISFYTFENLGGTLLPGNTDPWKKVPDGIGTNADKCTFLEVSGTYSTDGGTCTAPVTYRMYLGEDSTTNFDLVRNYIYDVTLVPSDEGIDRTSWKITRGTFSDSRDLTFTPVSITMNQNTSTTFTVIPNPSDMVYSVAGGTGFSSSTLSLAATGNANEYSLVSSGSLNADASTSVIATSWDGRVVANLPVTVYARTLSKIALTPASVTRMVGGTQAYTVTATYTTGGVESTEDVTSSSTLASSDPSVVSVSGMTATAVSGGSATLTAKYSDKSATATFNVDVETGREYRNASVTISADPVSFDATGGTSTLTYSASYEYRIKYTSGAYGEWTESVSTPAITGSATGFTRDGTSVTVAVNTGSERAVTYYADFTCPDGTTKATQKSVKISQSGDSEVSREYRNASVSISASPASFTAAGGESSLTCSASYEYRIKYTSGSYSDWTSAAGTPAITGDATGFTRSGNTVTVAANTGTSSRSVIYYADFTCPDGTTKATQKSAQITQSGDTEASREYQNASVSIAASPTSIAAAGGTSTLTYSASYQYRIKYVSGSYGQWTDASGTPTITGSATGFTRSGASVTVDANNGSSSRSVTYYADYTAPDGTTKATRKSVTITQAAGGKTITSSEITCGDIVGTGSRTISGKITYSDGSTVTSGLSFTVTGDAVSLSGNTVKGVSSTFGNTSESHRADLEGRSFMVYMYYEGKEITHQEYHVYPQLIALTVGSAKYVKVGSTVTLNCRLQVRNYYNGSAVTDGYVSVNSKSGMGCQVQTPQYLTHEGAGVVRGIMAGAGKLGFYYVDCGGQKVTANSYSITVQN